MNLDDLMDKMRQLLVGKWDTRRTIVNFFEGLILPHIKKRLKECFSLEMDVTRCSGMYG
jgi:hypothetical protein